MVCATLNHCIRCTYRIKHAHDTVKGEPNVDEGALRPAQHVRIYGFNSSVNVDRLALAA